MRISLPLITYKVLLQKSNYKKIKHHDIPESKYRLKILFSLA